MWGRALGRTGHRGVVITMVLRQVVLRHHVGAISDWQRGASQGQHGPTPCRAVCRRAVVGQSHGEVGTTGDGHVVHLLLWCWRSNLKLCVQIRLLLLLLVLLGPGGHAHHSCLGAQVRFDENIAGYRMNVEHRGEVRQCLSGGGGWDGTRHLQVRLCLDLLRCEGLVVGPVQARAEVSGAGKDDVDVKAVRGYRLFLGEEIVHHGGALPPVFLVGTIGGEAQKRTAHLGEIFVQIQLNLNRNKEAELPHLDSHIHQSCLEKHLVKKD